LKKLQMSQACKEKAIVLIYLGKVIVILITEAKRVKSTQIVGRNNRNLLQ